MAPSSGITDSPLLDDLLAHGHQFSFVQVLRLARRYLQQHGGVTPPEVPWQDRVRIRPELSLAFPAADVAKVEGDAADLRITATFLGLYGSASPLPTFFTEELLEEQAGDGSVLRHFFDVVHQRLYHLYFECWSKYNLLHQVVEDNSAAARQRLFCLIGLGEKELAESVPEAFSLLRYAGLLSQFPRSPSGLQSLLRDSLKEPNIRILQNIRRRVPIPEDQRLRLGLSGCRLGVDAVLGSHMDDVMGKFRIAIGPLSWEDYNSLVPGTPRYLKLCRLVAFYLPDPLEYDLELILAAGQARPLRLGDPEARLGLNTWCFAGDTLGELRTRFPSAPWPNHDTTPEGATLPDPRPAASEGTLADLYRRERAGLTDQIERFVTGHPNLAPMVSGPHADPGVERLLEGTALYCALLRRKLEDDVPEVIQEILQAIAPEHLEPVAAATVVTFTPKPHLTTSQTVPAGVQLDSVPLEGTSCQFTTSLAVEVHPLTVEHAAFSGPEGRAAAITLHIVLKNISLTDWQPQRLRFYLAGDYPQAANLYLLLTRHLSRVVLFSGSETDAVSLDPACLQTVGFGDNESLNPFASCPPSRGRILRDFTLLPEKFLLVELTGWESWTKRGKEGRFTLRFEFDTLPFRPGPVTADNFVLFATPAVNLFPVRSKVLMKTAQPMDHPVLSDRHDAAHLEVHSIQKVEGIIQGPATRLPFEPTWQAPWPSSNSCTFQIKRQVSPLRPGLDTTLRVRLTQEAGRYEEILLNMDLLCTNGKLPDKLRPGDICLPTDSSPPFARFANCIPATTAMAGDFLDNRAWRFLGLSIQNPRLLTAAGLRAILNLAGTNVSTQWRTTNALEQRLQGLVGFRAQPLGRVIRGEWRQGWTMELKLNGACFDGPGDVYLFGAVLNHFLREFVSEAFFIRTRVEDLQNGAAYDYPLMVGQRPRL